MLVTSIFSFSTMFSKAFFHRVVISQDCGVKSYFVDSIAQGQTTYSKQSNFWFTLSTFLLTHSLKYHSETVPNSKNLQKTTEMWLLRDF